MEGANYRSQQDPPGIQQNVPPSPLELYLRQQGLVPENIEGYASSRWGINLYDSQHRPSSQNAYHLLQPKPNVVPVSQQINMHESESNMVHNQRPEIREYPYYEPQHVNIGKADNTQVPMSAISHQEAVSMPMGNQQVVATGSRYQQSRNMLYPTLLPIILPQLDEARAKQLYFLYHQFQDGKVPENAFIQHMKSTAGEEMVNMAANQVLSQSGHLQPQSQVSGQQQNLPTAFTAQMMSYPRNQVADSNTLKSLEVEHRPNSQGTQLCQMSTSNSAANQERVCPSLTPHRLMQQPQHMDLSHAYFPTYGSAGHIHYSYSAMNANTSASPLKQQSDDSLRRVIPAHHSMYPTQLGTTIQGMNMGLSSFSSVNIEQGNASLGALKDESFEMQPSSVGSSTLTSTVQPNPVLPSMPNQMDTNNLLNYGIPSAKSPIHGGNSAEIPRIPSIGKKKPLEALDSLPPISRKKQKVSRAFLDQSMEQLDDVTTVSGVNIAEEEEQLFSGPKEDSHVSEASARIVQEEEDRLILEKIPLQQRLAEIIGKYGLEDFSNDVEKCLSLAVEERMCGLLRDLIRMTKQRFETEKPRHKIILSSDVPQQIMLINQRAREQLEKKQAGAEKLQKLSEPDGNPKVDGEKEKDEDGVRPVTMPGLMKAANVAVRSAVGGDDMLSKWQLMADQASKKSEGGIAAAPGSLPGKDMGRKLSSSRSSRDNEEVGKRGYSAANSTRAAAAGKEERNQFVGPQSKVARTISVKDVIAVLERDRQMSKSTFLYRLYESPHGCCVRSDILSSMGTGTGIGENH